MKAESVKIRKRHARNSSSVLAQTSEKSEDSTNQTAVKNKKALNVFLELSLVQIVFGAAYLVSLWMIFSIDRFEIYREKASWLFRLQHLTSWGTAHVGPRDVYYTVNAFVAIISLRALLQLLLYFILGIRKDLNTKAKIRFTEQAWCLVYYGSAAAWGLNLLQSQPYGWSASTLWIDFPHYYIDPPVKQYYLTILAYWISQVFVIHVEDRRKDHWQMLTHHIVTCCLVLGSFVWSYTRIGHLVMIMMDAVDIFLAFAKCSKYLKVPGWITDGCFVIFLISWVALRHILYMYEMIYSAFPAVRDLKGKCIYDFKNKSLGSPPIQCFSKTVHFTFFTLAIALQVITLMWLVMIIKVVARVVRGDGAADTRSDTEDD